MILAFTVTCLLAVPLRAQPPEQPPRASVGIFVQPTRPGAEQPGLAIRQVEPDGPAAKAGLKSGDLITRIGDTDIHSYRDMLNTIAQHKPGDKVAFHIRRDGKEENVTVTLGQNPRAPAQVPQRRLFPPTRAMAFLGVQTAPLAPEAKSRVGAGVDEGVVVTEVLPDTPAARAGLRVDDVITTMDGKAMTAVVSDANPAVAGQLISYTAFVS
jgi:serine protease Do